ncbi:MAG: hypothetical protein IPN29_01835 [Saprospiraceae bacterium]|nr:hypothetical protein [Saprospiraceae bacterium]
MKNRQMDRVGLSPFLTVQILRLASIIFFQVRDINAGHFLDGDSSFFELFKENLLKDKVTKLREETGLHNGYPSMRFDAVSDEEALFYKTKNVVRGNRVYSLMVLGHKSQKEDSGPDYFFNSLKLPIINLLTTRRNQRMIILSAVGFLQNLSGQKRRMMMTVQGFIIPATMQTKRFLMK